MHKILTKWIEPYVLLETLKVHSELIKDYIFDGFSKNEFKKRIFKISRKGKHVRFVYEKCK